MTNESLNVAIDVILEALDVTAIDDIDRVELMINITKFLAPAVYDDNIKTLRLTRTK